ncbi:MAG: hypothetical protein ABH879_01165 [archaeon]
MRAEEIFMERYRSLLAAEGLDPEVLNGKELPTRAVGTEDVTMVDLDLTWQKPAIRGIEGYAVTHDDLGAAVSGVLGLVRVLNGDTLVTVAGVKFGVGRKYILTSRAAEAAATPRGLYELVAASDNPLTPSAQMFRAVAEELYGRNRPVEQACQALVSVPTRLRTRDVDGVMVGWRESLAKSALDVCDRGVEGFAEICRETGRLLGAGRYEVTPLDSVRGANGKLTLYSRDCMRSATGYLAGNGVETKITTMP